MAEPAGQCQILDAAGALHHQRAQHRGVARPVVQLQIPVGLLDRRVELVEQGTQQRSQSCTLEIHDDNDI